MKPETAVASLRNLGPRTVQRLARVGIHTQADLRRTGAVAAYAALRRAAKGVTLNALYALQGALQDVDWRDVRRDQKLALLLAVEDHERSHPGRTGPAAGRRDELLALRNIGPAMRRDLALLGIGSVAQLARRDPQRLYRRLERLTGRRQDPCVLDTFAAAIHQARTGEALPWWQFSRQRKQRARAASRGSGS
jgi:hypothetical protein